MDRRGDLFIGPSGLLIRTDPSSAERMRGSNDEIITHGKCLLFLDLVNSMISTQFIIQPLESSCLYKCLSWIEKPLSCIDRCGVVRGIALSIVNTFGFDVRCRGHTDDKMKFSSLVSAEEDSVSVVDNSSRDKKKIQLDGWWIRPEKSLFTNGIVPNSKLLPTIVVFHEMTPFCFRHNVDYLQILRRSVPANIFVASYRGFGNNHKVSETTLQEDSMAFLEHVVNKPEVDSNQIFLLGRSMGGNLASYVGANTKHPIKGIMLENTFSCLAEQVSTFTYGFIPSRFVEKVKATLNMDAKRDLQTLPKNIPVYIMKADWDTVVDPIDSDSLLASSQNAAMITFKTWHLGSAKKYAKSYGWYIRQFIADADEFIRNTPVYDKSKKNDDE